MRCFGLGIEYGCAFACVFQISLGDTRSYYLSTAEQQLGVVSARSEAGERVKGGD